MINVLFTKDGKLIPPHLHYTLKSFFYTSETPIFFTDEKKQVMDAYPKEHFCKESWADSVVKQLVEAYNPPKKKLAEPPTTATISLFSPFIFLAAPVYDQKKLRGILWAGPLIIGRENQYTQTFQHHELSRFSVKKKPPRHLFLAQLMHHLLEKSIYIGPNQWKGESMKYIQPEDMALRNMEISVHQRLHFLAQLVLSQQKKEALALYHKSIVLNDFYLTPENTCPAKEDQSLLLFKQGLLTLETLISSGAVKQNCDEHKILILKNQFFSQIDQKFTYQDLVLSGENMIKVYSEVIRLKHQKNVSTAIRKAVDYIHEHFKSPLALQAIGEHVNLSSTYLSTRFKSEMDVSLTDYINQTRVKYSQYLLLHTDYSILEIAMESGFDHQNYFSTVFKKQTGLTPSAYRRKKI